MAAAFVLGTGIASGSPVFYQNPPAYIQYIEGEDSFDNNWVPGESRHFWWKDYAFVTGRGVLDLAATRLPEAGAFTAKYRFNAPQDGYYCIFARTRFPGYVASPFYWSIDGGAETRQPKDEAHLRENIVGEALNMKMALVRLGPFEAKQGSHTLAIAVRDFVTDGLPYLSQAIDALSVSRCTVEPFPESQPVAKTNVTLNVNVTPEGSAFPGSTIPLICQNWSYYNTLILPVRVESKSTENFEGRLRVFRADGSFTDLPVSVPPAKFGTMQDYALDLSGVFPKGTVAKVGSLWFYTNDKWYTAPHTYAATVGLPRLSGKSADSPKILIKEPQQGVPPPANKAAVKGESGDFVWNDVSNTGGSAKGGDTSTLSSVYVCHIDGKDRPAEVELLSAPSTDQLSKEQRIRFKVTNKSESDIYRVDFGFQGPLPARRGWFLAGSTKCDVRDVPAAGSLLGPSRLTHDWVCLPADGKTAYSYLEDSAHQDTRLQFARKEGRGIGWSFSKFVRIQPGESWTSPVIVVGQYDGEDWHPAADKFSQWWFSWAGKPKIPEWFRGIGGMEVGLNYPENGRKTDLESLDGHNRQAEGRKATNRKLLSAGREKVGIDWWHSGIWLPLGTEAWYPNGYLLNETQTKDLRELTDDVRAVGGRTSFYSNPLMLSRVAPQYGELSRWVVMDADGFPVFTEHTFRHHPMALMAADQEWGRKFAGFILPVVREVHPDALYMDQLGAVPIHLDWTKDLPASRVGLWSFNQGLFCQAVLNELDQVNPNLVTGIEGVNPYAQQYVTYSLLFDGDYSVLKYTFPPYTTMVGQYEEIDGVRAVRNAEKSLLTGQPLILINDPAKLDAATASRIKNIVELKRILDPVLYTLSYRDTVGLRVDEGMDASCFVGDKGEKVVVAVNRTKDWKTITVSPKTVQISQKWGIEQAKLSEAGLLSIPPDSFGAIELKEVR